MVQVLIILAFVAIFVALVLVIEFPEMFATASSYLDALLYYISQGIDIVWLFFPKTLTVTLVGLAVSVELLYLGYLFVMWILRKLPTGGIR